MSGAFRALGHDAWSCDLRPSDFPWHYEEDVLNILKHDRGWDLAIFHPPCTYLSNSSSKHLYIDGKKENGLDQERWYEMRKGARFFKRLWEADIPHVACENPIMLGYAKEIIGANYTQKVQPHWFGDPYQKATCLWLRNLPPLERTHWLPKPYKQEVFMMGPSEDRELKRSITYPGLAKAMAQQWSAYVLSNLQNR